MRGISETDLERAAASSERPRKDAQDDHRRAIEPPPSRVALARAIAAEIFGPPAERDFAVRYWDGTHEEPAAGAPRFTLVLNGPASLRRMLLPPTELRIAEAYIYGDVDVLGDLEAAATIGDRVRARLSPARVTKLAGMLLALPRGGASAQGARGLAARALGRARLTRRHSRTRDQAAIRSHYDVGNDFYALFLDERLVYSCGYFPTGAEDIHGAQRAKLDHLCRKLRLAAGETLLDVGCGWGALVRHAGREYGARAHGITLSREQAALARERIAAEGVDGRCTVEIRDYRDLPRDARFDKIVSVGMFEHVGREQLRKYFRRMFALTRPGGLFLNHGIVERGRRGRSLAASLGALLWREGAFIDRYVFPDGELVTLEEVVAAGEGAGFETRDVESLREHYAQTLRHWVRRLEAAAAKATALVGAETYRVWRLYMSASAHAFESGRISLAQVLFARPDDGGRVALPRTRADLYPPA